MISARYHSTPSTPDFLPAASHAKHWVTRQPPPTDPADLLPLDIWESVVNHLPPREQATLASTHSMWRDICRQPHWAMHRARLNAELHHCAAPADMLAVLKRHRHVLPHLDTLVLQPALKQRYEAAVDWKVEASGIFEAAPKASELYPVLDWLADACSRPFKIWVACKASFLFMVLTNGIDKRHPVLGDDLSHLPADSVDTPTQMLSVMTKIKSDSRLVWLSEIEEQLNKVETHPKFWQSYVECYPNVGHLFLTREVFASAGERLDELCELQELQHLFVPHVRPEELPPGLQKRYKAGKLRITDCAR